GGEGVDWIESGRGFVCRGGEGSDEGREAAEVQRLQDRAGAAGYRPCSDHRGGNGVKNMKTESKAIGKPVDRVDGRLKVTGKARYAAEARVENLAHGVLVCSTIARGKVKDIDASAAEK